MAPKPVWDDEKLAILARRDVSQKGLAALKEGGLIAALNSGAIDLEQVAEFQPTYRVHAYHDTGERLRVAGVDYPILAAQSSFGGMPDHVGPVLGWRHSIEFPPNVLKEQITPEFMRIHVPDNGKVHAMVRIEAVEQASAGGTLPWWVWLLLFLLLLLLFWIFS
jgi:hypothetical protein